MFFLPVQVIVRQRTMQIEEQTSEGSRGPATRSEHSSSMSLYSLAGEVVDLELDKGEGRAIRK